MFDATGGLTQPRAVGRESSFAATGTRVFPSISEPLPASEQYQTTHKAAFRRELHAPNPIIDASGRVATLNPHLPRRAERQQAAFLAQAREVHAAQQAAAAAAAAAASAEEQAELDNPFYGRAPMNRQRALKAPGAEFASEEEAMRALSQPGKTVWNDRSERQGKPAGSEFHRNVDFSRPIEDYKGASVWRYDTHAAQ